MLLLQKIEGYPSVFVDEKSSKTFCFSSKSISFYSNRSKRVFDIHKLDLLLQNRSISKNIMLLRKKSTDIWIRESKLILLNTEGAAIGVIHTAVRSSEHFPQNFIFY